MKKLKTISPSFFKVSFLLIVGIFFSFEASSQLTRSNVRPSPSPQCSSVTYWLYTTTPWANQIDVNMNSSVTFHTNVVCGATKYIWTAESGAYIETNEPTLTIPTSYLVWLPQGSCEEFNKKLDFHNNKVGGVGTFSTYFSVASDASSSITLPVFVSGVPKCSLAKYPKIAGPK